MHIVIGIVGALVAGYFFYQRLVVAKDAANELVGAANDVRLAARRFGFRRRTDVHPVEAIEDPNIAIATVAVGFIELDDLPTQEQQGALAEALRDTLTLTGAEAEELLVLGRWMVSQCGGADPAISRASRKLYKLSGTGAVTPLLTIVQDALAESGGGLSERQKDALGDVRRALHIR